ncbi:hypothetical protein A1F97_04073, partial [Pyrenophora tritici-repentis]
VAAWLPKEEPRDKPYGRQFKAESFDRAEALTKKLVGPLGRVTWATYETGEKRDSFGWTQWTKKQEFKLLVQKKV